MALTDHTGRCAHAIVKVREDIRKAGFIPLFTQATGSACYGKANPEDFDVLVLVRWDVSGSLNREDTLAFDKPPNLEHFVECMIAQGYKDCGEDGNTSGGNADAEDYRASWCALKAHISEEPFADVVNIIATNCPVWYYRQAAATALCKEHAQEAGTAPDKGTVVGIFRAVREGVNPFALEE